MLLKWLTLELWVWISFVFVSIITSVLSKTEQSYRLRILRYKMWDKLYESLFAAILISYWKRLTLNEPWQQSQKLCLIENEIIQKHTLFVIGRENMVRLVQDKIILLNLSYSTEKNNSQQLVHMDSSNTTWQFVRTESENGNAKINQKVCLISGKQNFTSITLILEPPVRGLGPRLIIEMQYQSAGRL